MNIIMIIFL